MKEIIRITVGLTISCLIAAFVMGSVFAITIKAKKHNEHLRIQETMLQLIGYGRDNPAPSDLKFHTVYRYVIEGKDAQDLGYMLPVSGNNAQAYALIVVSLDGKFIEKLDLNISAENAAEISERQTALRAVLPETETAYYADSFVIATLGERRLAYLIPREFPGFKTFIEVMLALDPSFTIIGLEIMEDEEDPGLGGEIEQDYFKNQFDQKDFRKVLELKVIKEPLPQDYKEYLEHKDDKESPFADEQVREIQRKYKDQDIYALTGATISSDAVTRGVRNAVKKFAYRLAILDEVLKNQKIPRTF